MPRFVAMKASKSFTYGSRRIAADETFNAHSKDARVLDAIGKAKLAGAEAAMEPEKRPPAPPVPPKAPATPKGKPKAPNKATASEKPAKGYKRRDIKPSETK